MPLEDALPLPSTESINTATAHLDALAVLPLLQVLQAQNAEVLTAVDAALPALATLIEATLPRLQQGGRLFYIGAGTSGRLGVLDASECPPTFGVSPQLVQGLIAGGEAALRNAIEGAEDDAVAGAACITEAGVVPADTVVGLSASGGAAFVCAALAAGKALGCLTASITCATPSPLEALADIAIVAPTGAEPITGSTRMKAGTAQKLLLNHLSTALMVQLGKTYGNAMVDVQPTNAKLRQRASRLVCRFGGCEEARALALLEACGWEVKTAILCQRLELSVAAARERLSQVAGRLSRVLPSLPPTSESPLR